mgnify:FL=1
MSSKTDLGSPHRRALLVGGLAAAGGAVALAKGASSQSAPAGEVTSGHDMSAMQADPYAAPMPGMAHGLSLIHI